jgi:hypothetical protein
MTELLNQLKSLAILNDKDANKELINLIKDKEIYDFVWPHGETLLFWAALENNVEICKYLIVEKKIHINISNFRGTTAIYYAAMNNSYNALEYLLNNYGHPGIKSNFSNKFPIDITTNQECKRILEKSTNDIIPFTLDEKIKTGYNKYQIYKYRVYMLFLSNLNYYYLGNKDYSHGIMINSETEEIFKTKGIRGISDYCQEVYDIYIDSLNKKELPIICLYCHNEVGVHRCMGCKEVFFCNKICQKQGHIIHGQDCLKS